MLNKKGFTLIEVLIVVAIIGILASVVLVGLGPLQKQGRDTRRIEDLKQLQAGLELYYNKNGYYPKSTFNVTATNAAAAWAAFRGELIANGGGISNVPSDPNASRNYMYGSDVNGTTYVLGALFDDPGNNALKNDIDSTVNSVDCGAAATDTTYCVQL